MSKDRPKEFEIEFYENLLNIKPDFTELLSRLGQEYTERGMVDEGLNIDLRLTKLRPHDPIALYNLACSYSLAGKLEESLQALKNAVLFGFSDFSHMCKDKDLEGLRKSRKFKEFLKKINSRLLSE